MGKHLIRYLNSIKKRESLIYRLQFKPGHWKQITMMIKNNRVCKINTETAWFAVSRGFARDDGYVILCWRWSWGDSEYNIFWIEFWSSFHDSDYLNLCVLEYLSSSREVFETFLRVEKMLTEFQLLFIACYFDYVRFAIEIRTAARGMRNRQLISTCILNRGCNWNENHESRKYILRLKMPRENEDVWGSLIIIGLAK